MHRQSDGDGTHSNPFQVYGDTPIQIQDSPEPDGQDILDPADFPEQTPLLAQSDQIQI